MLHTHRLHLKKTREIWNLTEHHLRIYSMNSVVFLPTKITLRQPSSKVSNKWQLKTSTWPYHDTVNFLLAVAVLAHLWYPAHIRSTAVWACPVTQSCPISCIAK